MSEQLLAFVRSVPNIDLPSDEAGCSNSTPQDCIVSRTGRSPEDRTATFRGRWRANERLSPSPGDPRLLPAVGKVTHRWPGRGLDTVDYSGSAGNPAFIPPLAPSARAFVMQIDWNSVFFPSYDAQYFCEVLDRHGLSGKWRAFCEKFDVIDPCSGLKP
ncbi:MAG TPA: hypothetical protein VK512_01000 [Xanthobacteraceae bacterium]|nr:hypothetical protein [Xanthobacteraceae bacterium]